MLLGYHRTSTQDPQQVPGSKQNALPWLSGCLQADRVMPMGPHRTGDRSQRQERMSREGTHGCWQCANTWHDGMCVGFEANRRSCRWPSPKHTRVVPRLLPQCLTQAAQTCEGYSDSIGIAGCVKWSTSHHHLTSNEASF